MLCLLIKSEAETQYGVRSLVCVFGCGHVEIMCAGSAAAGAEHHPSAAVDGAASLYSYMVCDGGDCRCNPVI